MTNSPFATSQPLTISSGPTSRSCVGHQRFCRIGVRHSRCSCRNDTSEARAFGDVASARPTGMLTRPKLSEPFQIVRMRTSIVRGTASLRLVAPRFLHYASSRGAGRERRAPRASLRRRERSAACGSTPSPRTARRLRTSSSATAAGSRCRGTTRRETVDELANGLLAAASARETRSRSSARRRSSGRCSTSRSPSSARSALRSTRTARPRTRSTSSTHSEAVAALCEDEEQRAKIEPLELAARLDVRASSTNCASADARYATRASRCAPRGGCEPSARTTSSRTSTRRARPARRRRA